MRPPNVYVANFVACAISWFAASHLMASPKFTAYVSHIRNTSGVTTSGSGNVISDDVIEFVAENPEASYQAAQDSLNNNCNDPSFRQKFNYGSFVVESYQSCVTLPLFVVPRVSGLEETVQACADIRKFVENSANMSIDRYENIINMLISKMNTLQNIEINSKRNDLVSRFKENLKAQAERRMQPEIRKLADIRDSQRRFADLIKKYSSIVDSLMSDYMVLAKNFRDNQGKLVDQAIAIKSLSAQGSAANVDQLPAISVSIAEAGLKATRVIAAEQFALGALEHRTARVQSDFERELAPISSELADQGTPKVDAVGAILAGVRKMQGQYRIASKTFTDSMTAAQSSMDKRLNVLIQQKAALMARQAEINAMQLGSSSEFLKSTNALIKNAWRLLPTVNKLPIYSGQYHAMLDLLAQEPLCQNARAAGQAWMQTGCKFLAVEITKVKSYQAETLPIILSASLDLVPTSGQKSAPLLVEHARNALADHKIADAIACYELAVQAGGER